MAFNGSGVFVRLRNWVNDRDASVKIRADLHDSEDDGFATGLSNCITKDGQTTITANIPFNSKKATGLADGTASGDAVHFGQVRYRLSADTTLYWRASGAGSGIGAATNDDAHAFPSAQTALDWVCDNIDLNSHNLTIKAGNASAAWTAGISTNKNPVGGNGVASVSLDWNSGTLTVTGGNCIDIGDTNGWGGVDTALTIQNVTLSAVSSGNLIQMRGGIIQIGSGVTFGAIPSAGVHGYLGHGAQLFSGNHTVSGGNAAGYRWFCYDGATIVEESATITFSAPVSFIAYLALTSGARALMGATYTNKSNVTAQKFNLAEGGICNTGTLGDLTNLPGNTVGVWDASSSYDGIPGGSAFTVYTPVISSGSGTITTKSATGRWQQLGKIIHYQLVINITTNGTGASYVIASLPTISAAFRFYSIGQEILTGGGALLGCVNASSATINITKMDLTYPGVDGAQIEISGFYETA